MDRPAARRAALPLILVALAGGACTAPRMPDAAARAQLALRHAHTAVELRQSCYYGELYDENELYLLSPRPFAATSHIDDPAGRPLRPARQRGIIAAGTPLCIESIEFPEPWTMARRLLTTPRYSPWVILRGTAGAADVPAGAPPLVIVLPLGLADAAQVDAALAAALSPAGETSAWLRGRRPAVRAAIAEKQAVRGMQRDELVAALGPPPHWLTDRLAGQPAQVAWYEEGEVWLQDDVVADLRASRALPQATAGVPMPALAAPLG